MHVSLDSALGRQRRLNSVGESVLQIAPSAAAAYSLRSLTGGDPKVVRVRRDTGGGAGDNDEQDFTASGISSGALVDFVGSGNDGFVETWYDQSGNGNNLTRLVASSQPTIVSGGSLILNADGHAGVGLRRDTSGSSLLIFDSGIDIINSHSFQYVEFQRTFGYTLTSSTAGGSNRIGYISSNNLQIKRGGNTNVDSGLTTTIDNPLLYTTFLAADGSASNVHVNGSERLNSVLGDGTGNTTFSSIGRGDNDSAVGKFILISELIIYASDQSANRTALETNMNSHYSIF